MAQDVGPEFKHQNSEKKIQEKKLERYYID
jgi:hypothetical protein